MVVMIDQSLAMIIIHTITVVIFSNGQIVMSPDMDLVKLR